MRQCRGGLGGEKEAGLGVAKEGANRRQIAGDHGNSAGPVFENFHRDIQHEFGNGLQRADTYGCFAERFGHLFVVEASADFDEVCDTGGVNSLADRLLGRIVIEIADQEKLWRAIASRKQTQGLDQNEDPGALRKAAAIDKIKCLRASRRAGGEKSKVREIVKDEFSGREI